MLDSEIRKRPCGQVGQATQWLVVLALCLAGSVSGFSATAKPAGYAQIAVDAQTGQVVSARQSEVSWHPASLTKMMTLYQLFSALQRRSVTLQTKIKISPRAARQPPSKLGLRPGRTITVAAAIEALAVKSANDIAVAVAEHLAGSEQEFAKRMTTTARYLGMSRTNFRNASGLHHSLQVTTARDMAILSIALMRDFPEYYPYFSKKSFRYGRLTYNNHNRILNAYSGADGIKTGYIAMSGFNLSASAVRNNRRVVAVILGATSSDQRTALMHGLLDQGFKELASSRPARIARPLPINLSPPQPASASRTVHRQARWPRVAPVPRPSPVHQVQGATASNQASDAADATQGWVVPPVRPTAAAAEAGSAYAVQVGAFRTPALARQQLEEVLDTLPEPHSTAQPRVISFQHPSQGVFYRARLFGYEDRSAASELCRWLQRHRTECAVVSGGG